MYANKEVPGTAKCRGRFLCEKLTLSQLQRANALSYLLDGTIENAFLLGIERIDMPANLRAIETLGEPCRTLAKVILSDVSKRKQLVILSLYLLA